MNNFERLLEGDNPISRAVGRAASAVGGEMAKRGRERVSDDDEVRAAKRRNTTKTRIANVNKRHKIVQNIKHKIGSTVRNKLRK